MTTLHGQDFWVGWNHPWHVNGHDFGRNAWGHDGISTGGWAVSTYPGSRGFTSSRVVRGEPCADCGSLRISMAIDPREPSGEVTLDLASHLPTICPAAVPAEQDLSRAHVRFKVWLPRGAAGAADARNGIQVIFKTRVSDEQWASVYSAWRNIEPRMENTYTEFTVPVSTVGAAHVDPGVDLSRVHLIGIKVGLNSASRGSIGGNIYLDDLVIELGSNVSWDFERLTIDQEFTAIRNASRGTMTVARVFLCADGRACPDFDTNGRVTGFDEAFFDDFDAILSAATRNGIQLIVTLFDYTMAWRPFHVAGVQLGGRADVLRDPEKRDTFFAAFADLLRRYANHPGILAWQPINEPERILENVPDPKPEGVEYVPLDTMRTFVRLTAESVHRLSPVHQVTIGNATRSSTRLWTGLGLDAYGVHWYDSLVDEPFPFAACPADLDGPCYLEEVPTAGTSHRASEFLQSARESGYAGLALWSCRGGDGQSDLASALADLYGPRQ